MKIAPLVVSHSVAFACAFWLSGGLQKSASERKASVTPTKSTNARESVREGDGDVESVLAPFLPGYSSPIVEPRFKSLAAGITPADELEAAVRKAKGELPEDYRRRNREVDFDDFFAIDWGSLVGREGVRRIAEFEMRLYQWMMSDPEKAIGFLREDGWVGHALYSGMMVIVARERGYEDSKDWIAMFPPAANRYLSELAEREEDESKVQEILSGPGSEYLSSRRDSVSFEKMDEVMIKLAEGASGDSRGTYQLTDFLRKNDHSQLEVLQWMNKSLDEVAIAGKHQKKVTDAFTKWVKEASELPLDERVAALEKLGKKNGNIYQELARNDVYGLLKEGRDWGYEFRNGRVSAEEVWTTISTELSEVVQMGEEGARTAAFRHLAEEDHEKALVLLNPLPEEKRREILFQSTWKAFAFLHPNDLLQYSQSLPETKNKAERELINKGWNWKARHYLNRHGEDFVEWVKEMPEGPDKRVALGSLVWATRERHPERVEELKKNIYPDS